MPQDVWFYNYARTLFDARKEYFESGNWNPPSADIPRDLIGCQSTRDMIQCNSGALHYQLEMPEIPPEGEHKREWYENLKNIMLNTNLESNNVEIR